MWKIGGNPKTSHYILQLWPGQFYDQAFVHAAQHVGQGKDHGRDGPARMAFKVAKQGGTSLGYGG